MTVMPHTVAENVSVKDALSMMREYSIRHLPVLKAGALIGVVTDRDIKLASGFTDAAKLTVEEVMTQEPYAIPPQTPTDHVVATMAEHKYGCAIICQENGKVVGVFTANDALRVLSETLKENYKTIN